MSEVCYLNSVVADLSRKPGHLLMRSFQKILENSKLVHQLKRRRVNRIAPKVAQKISVLLENDNVDTSSRQEQAEHHSGGSATCDTAASLDYCGRHDWILASCSVVSGQCPSFLPQDPKPKEAATLGFGLEPRCGKNPWGTVPY